MPARRFPPPWFVEEFDLDQTTSFGDQVLFSA
jgi:hypothetical protein